MKGFITDYEGQFVNSFSVSNQIPLPSDIQVNLYQEFSIYGFVCRKNEIIYRADSVEVNETNKTVEFLKMTYKDKTKEQSKDK